MKQFSTIKINISIDDVSTHPLSSVKCLTHCLSLIKKYPDIKFTLFIPTAYQRYADGDKFPSFLNEEFADYINSLPINNFEFGSHGFSHGTIYPSVSNNNEFQDKDIAECYARMATAGVIFDNLGIKFKKIFRPSAFRMSPPAFYVSELAGYTLCLRKSDILDEVYKGYDKTYPRVVYTSFIPGIDDMFVSDKLEIVYHALEKDKSYFSREKAEELDVFIQQCFEQSEKVEFCFIEDLVEKRETT